MNALDSIATLKTASGTARYVSLAKLAAETGTDLARLPHTVKILLENIARRAGGRDVSQADVESLARWPDGADASLAFMPARVLMQDFTGVPAVVDLAAMRSAVAARRRRPEGRQPVRAGRPGHRPLGAGRSLRQCRCLRRQPAMGIPSATANATRCSTGRSRPSTDFRVVPPGMGICHQVNLEHLGQVVIERDGWVFPDTVVGTDSHTPMINGLGVLGWGVGGIEAEAAMLGQPMFLPKPVVLGVRTRGRIAAGHHRHRSGADLDADAQGTRRGRQVRRVLRPRPEQPEHRRPRHAVEHVARIRRHGDAVPGRCEHLEVPAPDRARRKRRSGRALHA